MQLNILAELQGQNLSFIKHQNVELQSCKNSFRKDKRGFWIITQMKTHNDAVFLWLRNRSTLQVPGACFLFQASKGVYFVISYPATWATEANYASCKLFKPTNFPDNSNIKSYCRTLQYHSDPALYPYAFVTLINTYNFITLGPPLDAVKARLEVALISPV